MKPDDPTPGRHSYLSSRAPSSVPTGGEGHPDRRVFPPAEDAGENPTLRSRYNPIPEPGSPRRREADDDVWYGPEPARPPWRLIVPIAAVILLVIGALVWSALPETGARPEQAKPTPLQTLTGTVNARTLFTPLKPPPSSPHGTPSRSRPTHRTSSPAPTLAPQPTAAPTSIARPSTRHPVKPKPTLSPLGPEEPPDQEIPHRTLAPPSCQTWGDCHDDPPH